MASPVELYGVMRSGSVSVGGPAYDLKLGGLSVAMSTWLLGGGIVWSGVGVGVLGSGMCTGVVGGGGGGEALFLSGLVSGGLVGAGLVWGGVGGALGSYVYRVSGISAVLGSGSVVVGGVVWSDILMLESLIVGEFSLRGVRGVVGEERALAMGVVNVMASLVGNGVIVGAVVVPPVGGGSPLQLKVM